MAAMALDDAVALALQAAPGTRLFNAVLPSRPDQALRIGLVLPEYAEGAPAITVLVDPWRQSVIGVFDPRDYSAGETILAWQRGLQDRKSTRLNSSHSCAHRMPSS